MLATEITVTPCDGCGKWHDPANMIYHKTDDLWLCRTECNPLWKDPQKYYQKFGSRPWPRLGWNPERC